MLEIENAACYIDDDEDLLDLDKIIQSIVAIGMALRFSFFKIAFSKSWENKTNLEVHRMDFELLTAFI